MPPLLSLPIPRLPGGIIENLPIRVPFPFMRIASILPHAINEPIKASLMALFRLAWSAKLQIPVLITVVFMACDIRLQLEINIFWEANHVRPHGSNRNTNGQRRASREDMRRTALVAAALYQQQRRRLIQEIRAQQVRQREESAAAQVASLPVNAPLATEEDSDLEGSHDGEYYESDTVTCSHRSTVSSFGSNEDETEDPEYNSGKHTVTKKKRRTKRSRPSSREPDDDDDDEDDDSTTDEDEEDDDDDENGGGMNGGPSSHGGGGGYRDDAYDDDDDSDDLDDSSHADVGGGYNSPLVLEIELRHRPLYPPSNEGVENCQMSKAQVVKLNAIYLKHTSIFSTSLNKQYNLRSVINCDKKNINGCSTEVPQVLL